MTETPMPEKIKYSMLSRREIRKEFCDFEKSAKGEEKRPQSLIGKI
jgi:hypothetical protein